MEVPTKVVEAVVNVNLVGLLLCTKVVRSKEEGGRMKEEGGNRKEKGGRRKEEGGRRTE